MTDNKDIADTLTETFAKNHSSKNGRQKFLVLKQNAVKYKVNFQSKTTENNNNPLSLAVLKSSLKRFQNTAVEPEIHYEFFKTITRKISCASPKYI